MPSSRVLATLAFFPSFLSLAQTPNSSDPRLYRFLIEQNKAQIVVLSESRLLPPPLVRDIARALQAAHSRNLSYSSFSSNYLDLEAQLVAAIGRAASNLHIARSRNDLGATSERMVLRQETLHLLRLLAGARQPLLDLAAAHRETVIPGFTHSVQAQPTSLAHYLSAVLSSLERDEQRLRQAYARIDSSPLGAAAFTTSGFPLDRNRLRDLLGFSSLLENSYDAIMLSTVDSKAEFAAALAVSSLNIGRFAQQFLIQYSDSRPGLDLADSAVGHSSIMPQKRNPQVAERLRISASAVLGEAQTLLLTAHNTPAGEVADIRIPLLDRALTLSRDAASMLTFLSGLAAAIRVHPDRTLELVSDDYSVMTELADALYRHAAVPFRTGHKFASDLAAFGRARRLRPLDIPFADVDSVYRASTGSPCPLTPQQVRDALDPLHFVRSRQGLGGPQPAEVERMLTQHRERLASLRAWIDSENARLAAAGRRLDEAFSRLAGDSPL